MVGAMEGTTINSMGNMGFTPQPTAPTPKKNNKGKLIIAVIAALLIAGGIFMFVKGSTQNKNEEKKEEAIPTAEPTEEIEPTEEVEPTEKATSPTPTKAVSPTPIPTTGAITSATEMNVTVLNGTDKAGAAGEAATFLKSKGYKSVTTGNTDTVDFTGITVKVKSSRSKFLDALVTTLKEKYTINASSSDLPDSSAVDAQVIIGK